MYYIIHVIKTPTEINFTFEKISKTLVKKHVMKLETIQEISECNALRADV